MKSRLQRQKGAGLIEILISVVVLAVGLTGVAAMQVRSVRNNAAALQHSIAVIQAQSMADLLAISRAQALAGDFNITLTATNPTGQTFIPKSITEWRTSISSLLGAGATGSVNCVNASSTCTILVQWDNSRATEGSAAQQLQLGIRL
ncbi:hypothetical protein [uncultured Thiothrix sp.]|uniref:type IV pilus modification PilV family protein n=1 Tax=uncultured Thiothrix sp. TaxID=223185 RepID=UPI0026175886|nr:hypothetical protein [uncultured Thiothrix sp.]